MVKVLLPDEHSEQHVNLRTKLKNVLPGVEILTFEPDNLFRIASHEKPEIVFLHVNTEKESAVDLCRRLKADASTKDIPVVLLTERDSDNRQKALQSGVESFLILPIDEIELKALMKTMLKIRKSNIHPKKKNDQLENELFELASDFVFLHYFDSENGAGKITHVSNIACERLGYSKEELIQMKPLDLTTDANQKVSEVSVQLAKSGTLKFEKILVTKEGEHIPVEFHARVVEYLGQQRVLSIGRDITDRKNATEQLQASEEKFHKFFKSSPVPESIWSFEGKIFKLIDVNNAALKASQGQALNYIGLAAEEVYPDRKDIIERLEFCLEKRRNLVFETDFAVRNKKRRIIFTYVYVSETLVLLHTEDITEQKRAQKELEENEVKFRSLISEMDQGLAVYEAVYNENGKMVDYRFVDFNDSFERHIGLKRGEVLGKTVREVIPDAENYWFEQYEKVVKRGVAAHFEQFNAALGKYYEIVAYRNQKKQFATVITDITDRKKQLKELSLHNERLEALTRILKYDFNDSKELLNYAINQAVNLTESKSGFIFYYSEDTRKASLQAWSRNVEEECKIDDDRTEYTIESAGCWAEAVHKRKAFIINDYSAPDKRKKGIPGGHIDMKRFLSAPVLVDGEIKAVVGVANKDSEYNDKDVKQVTLLMDTLWKVVERKLHNEQLLAAKEKAEESDRLKSAFLTNMSHEIRTPMNGILGFADMLKEVDVSSDKLGNYVDIIEKSGKRMLNTIDDLMDISRIESKLVEVNFTEVNVNEQIDALNTFFRPDAESRGLQMKSIKPLSNEKAVIETDRDKFYAVLKNLIKNALKYTNNGSIEFGYVTKKDALLFFVKDTGIGIEKDKFEAIFERFVQADNSLSKPYEGVGLGLALAKAYTNLIGGKIWVESEKDKGSEFFLEVPFKGEIVIPESKIPEQKEEQPDTEKNTPLENLTVLVAEDDEVGRLYLQQLLNGKCKNIFYANNGKEAVEIYAEHSGIDLILMDIKMPVMDGYSATIKIRSMDHNAVIIAQTAYALSGDREKAIAAGCDEYLTKPLSKENLISTIENYF